MKDCLKFKKNLERIHYSVFLFSHYVLSNILLSIQVTYKKDNQFCLARKRVLGGEEMRGSSALIAYCLFIILGVFSRDKKQLIRPSSRSL